jgi:predicted nucleotidyltransferase
MSDRATAIADDAHAEAAAAFVERARSEFDEQIEALYVFGSTARGEASGIDSDVDVLLVLADDADSTVDALHDVAYDVMLEYGPVVELHVLTAAEFRKARSRGDHFVDTVVHEGRSYA